MACFPPSRHLVQGYSWDNGCRVQGVFSIYSTTIRWWQWPAISLALSSPTRDSPFAADMCGMTETHGLLPLFTRHPILISLLSCSGNLHFLNPLVRRPDVHIGGVNPCCSCIAGPTLVKTGTWV